MVELNETDITDELKDTDVIEDRRVEVDLIMWEPNDLIDVGWIFESKFLTIDNNR